MQRLLPILEVVARRVMEGGEKLCGVEQEGGECHVREELVGRRHADNGRSERGKSHEYVGRSTFVFST